MKSLSLLKSPINEKLKIIHIYGTKAVKEKLRSLAIDINSYIYIIDKTDEIIIESGHIDRSTPDCNAQTE